MQGQAQPVLDVAYGPHAKHRLDVFPAHGAAPGRLAIYVHGGAWIGGGKRAGERIASVLNPAGYTLAAICYRLVGQTDVSGCMDDLARAAAFLLGAADRFAIEPGRFAVFGHSAGGHLVALLGTDQRFLRAAGVDPGNLAVVIGMDGLYDIAADRTRYPNKIPPQVFDTDKADWRRYSPVAHIGTMGVPPRFGIIYENTRKRFVDQAVLFEAALRDAGVQVKTAVVPGLSHVEMMKFIQDASRPVGGHLVALLDWGFGR